MAFIGQILFSQLVLFADGSGNRRRAGTAHPLSSWNPAFPYEPAPSATAPRILAWDECHAMIVRLTWKRRPRDASNTNKIRETLMNATATNRQWLINGNPRGRALALSDFKAHEAELQPLGDGQVRVRVETLGFDPAQKGQMENVAGYTSGAEVGNVMSARGIGEVVETRNPRIAEGDKAIGAVGWQEYASLDGSAVEVLPNDDLLTAHLGPLGVTGLTAYFGLLRIGRPEPGDNIVVSGAAGAVGSMVVQIAQIPRRPGHRHRRRPGEMRLARRRTGLRGGHRLQEREHQAAHHRTLPRRHRRCFSTMSAATP